MGTNYYLHTKPACECCGRDYEGVHIGKSSGGWCFSLRVDPDEMINTLDDWRALWSQPGAYILNEYGEKVPIDEMERIITQRQGRVSWGDSTQWKNAFYASAEQFHASNHSQAGPNGLARHTIDGRHCVGHGEGTWDYVRGIFS